MADRYSRQILFQPIGEEGQRRLRSSRVTLIGCGALGSMIANNLSRAGVGFLRIVDRDFVELDNLQRQCLFDEGDVRANFPKAVAAAEKIRKINSEVVVDPVVSDATVGNMEGFIGDVDLVLDGTDNFETRFLINDVCVKVGRPWVYGGCVGSYGMVLTILPGETACFRCVLSDLPAPGSSPTCDTAGVLNSLVGVVASLESNEALKLLTGHREALIAGMLTVDLWTNECHTFRVSRSGDCRACVQRRFDALFLSEASVAATLCGRDAVQISPKGGMTIDLDGLERMLKPVGRVVRNEFLLKFWVDSYEVTLFPDARAIIKGTTDEARARSLYAKYVGI